MGLRQLAVVNHGRARGRASSRLEKRVSARRDHVKVVRSGCTLTVLRKESDGRWVIARDANLLATKQS